MNIFEQMHNAAQFKRYDDNLKMARMITHTGPPVSLTYRTYSADSLAKKIDELKRRGWRLVATHVIWDVVKPPYTWGERYQAILTKSPRLWFAAP